MTDQAEATFYVATDGSDAYSGKLAQPNGDRTDGPFATLVRARNAMREMRTDGKLPGPVTVMVRGGKYFHGETIVLSARDSGTQDCPVTYAAYPGEKPILSGGRRLSGWKPYKGRIVQCHKMKKEPPRRDDEPEWSYEWRLKSYPSRRPAQFVIELRAGSIDRLKLEPGQTIELDYARLRRMAR